MEKRLFLAIVLSIFVLIVYSGITARFAPQQQNPLERNFEESSPSSTSFPSQTIQPVAFSSPAAVPQQLIADISPIVLDSNELHLEVSRVGNGIQEAFINKYETLLLQNNIGGIVGWAGHEFHEGDITGGKSLSYKDKDLELTLVKRYRFLEEQNIVEMEIEFINSSNKVSYVDFGVNIATIDELLMKKNQMEQRYVEFVLAFPDQVMRKQFAAFKPPTLEEAPLWFGVRDRYFCSIIVPLQAVTRIEKHKESGKISYIAHSERVKIDPKSSVSQKFRIYIGPQIPSLLSQLGVGAERIIHYGILDPVSKALLGILRFIYKFCHNWGLTLIIFSIFAFVVMSPLSTKSFSSMKKMQELQPEIELLKSKFKDNSQKLNRELMQLYKERKINPLGGCLPMLLQMPIFISLFQLLIRFVDLKGASFLWIKDLAEPDRLFVFSKSLPIVGNEVNLLPIIMIFTMLAQQRLTGAQQTKGGASAQQQKMMSLFMSVFFGIIFYRMPSGLVLYWSVNSLLMFVFQLKLFKKPKKVS